MARPQLVRIVFSALEPSTGCPNIGAVCLAASQAAHELGRPLQGTRVTASSEIFENGATAGVPGTGSRGLIIATAPCAVLNQFELGLAIPDPVDGDVLRRAEAIGSLATVKIHPCPSRLTILAEVSADSNQASVTAAKDYCTSAEVTRNGSERYAAPATKGKEIEENLSKCRLYDLFAVSLAVSAEDLDFPF